jgi:hypothetical protein
VCSPAFVDINDAGAVIFSGYVSGGSVDGFGLFRGSSGTNAPIALAGDTAPDTAGGTYSIILTSRRRSVNSSGDVVFTASVTGGSSSRRVFEYIEMFYNRTRRHSHLGGVSPETFETASMVGL